MYNTLAELGQHIDHEGGLDSFLYRWVPEPEDVPEDIRLEWEEMTNAWYRFCEHRDEIMDKIDGAYQEAIRNGEIEVY